MNSERTLADLTEGSQVAIEYGRSGRYTLSMIRKKDAKGRIQVDTGRVFDKDGRPIMTKGERFPSYERLFPVTEEILAAIEKERLVSALTPLGVNEWRNMSVETLHAIFTLIQHEGTSKG